MGEDIVSEISKKGHCVRRGGKCGRTYRRTCCYGLYCGRVGRVGRCKKMIGKSEKPMESEESEESKDTFDDIVSEISKKGRCVRRGDKCSPGNCCKGLNCVRRGRVRLCK